MIFINSPRWVLVLWIISGLISFFWSAAIRTEMEATLKNGKLFHFFGGIMYALFTAFLFGPLSYGVIYLILKFSNRNSTK
ncbi:MAG: hypothetical protein CBE26_04105 [Kiritimatiellaceae bacterium TMED266]|nr:MAG: hypothetical protein CBE26_04105 [Kiritimatiellaceae bacterium TMED266]